MFLKYYQKNLKELKRLSSTIHTFQQIHTQSICVIWLSACFTLRIMLQRGICLMPVFCFVVVFLFCCDCFILLRVFSFLVSFQIHFAVSVLFCCEF